MYPVAYLHCERCDARRLFVSSEEAPPIDENNSLCETCGFSFGYRAIDEVVVVNGIARVEHVLRPRLDADVMLAGIREYRDEYTARLRATGQTIDSVKAQRQLDSLGGLDLEERRRITRPAARTGALDPGQAALVLNPKVPRNRPGRGEVE